MKIEEASILGIQSDIGGFLRKISGCEHKGGQHLRDTIRHRRLSEEDI